MLPLPTNLYNSQNICKIYFIHDMDVSVFILMLILPFVNNKKLYEIFSVDYRSLAAFRIAIGLEGVCNLLVQFSDVEALYSDYGIFPRYVSTSRFIDPNTISIYNMSGSVWFVTILFIVNICSNLCMAIGYRTRLCTIVSWFLAMSLHERNILVVYGADQLQRCMLFFAMFAPLGKRWSIDSLLNPITSYSTAKVKIDEEIEDEEIEDEDEDDNNSCHEISALAMIFQIFIMYICVGFHKLDGEHWTTTGNASWMALQSDYMRTTIGYLCLYYIPLWIFRMATFGVLYVQLFGFIPWFSPVLTKYGKTLSFLLYFEMHFVFGVCMNLGHFTWVTLSCTLLLIPGWLWTTLSTTSIISNITNWILRIGYNDLLTCIDQWKEKNVDASKSRNISVFNKRKRGLLRGMKDGLIIFFVVMVILVNVETLPQTKDTIRMPNILKRVVTITGIDQMWKLFSPAPNTDIWFPEIHATLNDGTSAYLLKKRALFTRIPTTEVDDSELDTGLNIDDYGGTLRWRRYFLAYKTKELEYTQVRRVFAHWLCRHFNQNLPKEKAVDSFTVYIVHTILDVDGDVLLPEFNRVKIRREQMWQQTCP